jgi:hypothetical protein
VQVRSELSQKLKKAVKDVSQLGPKRQTREEQFQYVVDVAIRFQNLVSDALQAGYSRAELFGSNPTLRLATQAIDRGETFAKALESHGHVYQFQTKSTSIQDAILGLTMDSPADVNVRTVKDHPDIEDLSHGNSLDSAPSGDDIVEWIDELYRDSRGFELGTFDATILGVILQKQAANWGYLAHGYSSDIIALVHNFIIEVLHQIAPSRRVSDGIKSLLLYDLKKMYRDAIDYTQFLLDIELHGTSATYNHYFNENLQKWYVISKQTVPR